MKMAKTNAEKIRIEFEKARRKDNSTNFILTPRDRCSLATRLTQGECVAEINFPQGAYHLAERGLIIDAGKYRRDIPYNEMRSVELHPTGLSEAETEAVHEEIMRYDEDIPLSEPPHSCSKEFADIHEKLVLVKKDNQRIELPYLGDAFFPVWFSLNWILRN